MTASWRRIAWMFVVILLLPVPVLAAGGGGGGGGDAAKAKDPAYAAAVQAIDAKDFARAITLLDVVVVAAKSATISSSRSSNRFKILSQEYDTKIFFLGSPWSPARSPASYQRFMLVGSVR